MPVGSSSAVSVIAPEPGLVVSLSFAINLNRNCDTVVGETGPLEEVAFTTPSSPAMVPFFGEVEVPDGVEDAFHDNDDDDVEPATIADDSDNETPWTTPVVGRGTFSSGINQNPPHFFALDLDAMAPQEDLSVPVGFGARDTQNTGGVFEFQVGQQFQDKEKVVFSVKIYSIRRGIEYKVLELDHRKYYIKCKEFGGGCAWFIQVSLRQRKGSCKVKRYNGPHICLATISSDHRKFDYELVFIYLSALKIKFSVFELFL
ncbi:hypothetical protein Ahy_B08g091065 [Arachis hypogaea]|uniref:Transposase MuDR plant domain-containing protein n=1 Tax=Arachis hypogaea TaxID=3818 RepID=A0A444Y1D6_ARAHY|nr:hypothetical protein Ahy_B08g091065 [Arachis hypogaea]